LEHYDSVNADRERLAIENKELKEKNDLKDRELE